MYTLPETPVRRLRDIADLPSWAPEYGRTAWSLSRNTSLPVDDEAAALAYLDHPELAQVWAVFQPDPFLIEGTNPRLHVTLHQIIETQLLQNDPPATREAMSHLLEIGIDRHTAIHLVLDGLIPGLHTVLTNNQPFDRPAYIAHLDTLRRARIGATGPSPQKTGRNDPCPCGSGQKYKRCCGVSAAAPVIDPRKAKMILGDGYYAGPNGAQLPQNHPLLYLENLGAVAQALEMSNAEAEAAEAYRRIVAVAEQLDEGVLNDALQSQMEFAMNNPAYAEDGIAAARRLMTLELNRDNQDMLTVDMADFYDDIGQPEVTESLYREMLARESKEPFVYLRWARRLTRWKRRDEAEATYRLFIAKNGLGDKSLLREARAELAELLQPET